MMVPDDYEYKMRIQYDKDHDRVLTLTELELVCKDLIAKCREPNSFFNENQIIAYKMIRRAMQNAQTYDPIMDEPTV